VTDDTKDAPTAPEPPDAELSDTDIGEVAGGINPQPLPPMPQHERT
jgi:hypothetical protein